MGRRHVIFHFTSYFTIEAVKIMFILSELKSLVRLFPRGFNKSLEDQVTDELNRKLANKVLLNVGLCLSLYDILEIGDSFIFPGDGSSHTRVRFRMLVFRPEIEEVLVGKIKNCSKEGVQVSLEFFDDILIPSDSLQHPARYDDSESVWIWEYPLEDGEHHDLFMDAGEQIRFKIVSESFVDSGPVKSKSGAETEVKKDEVKVSPFSLTASINEPGLGLLKWWEAS